MSKPKCFGMIQIKYKALFDLEFLHTFYTSGKSPDIEMVPTSQCITTMQYFGLRFLPTEAGGKLLAKMKTEAGKDVIKNPLPDGTKFSFALKLKNTFFENFTELNVSKPKGSHYYFSNQTNNISVDNFPLLVINTASKVASDGDLMPFAGNSFSYTHNSTIATAHSELNFIDSGEKFSQSLDNNNDVFNFSYDLKKTNGGRAKFIVEGAGITSMYVVNPSNDSNLFGIVEIFYTATLATAHQFLNADKTVDTKFYKIAFASRATKWRYIVSKQFNQAITSINVSKANGSPITFAEQPGAPPGQFIVASSNALPAKEEPVAGSKLKDQDSKIIIDNLPNPSFGLIKRESTDIFSDILITI